jgi:hypothetical protein
MKRFWLAPLGNLDIIVLAVVAANWQFLTGTPLSWRAALIVAGLVRPLLREWQGSGDALATL